MERVGTRVGFCAAVPSAIRPWSCAPRAGSAPSPWTGAGSSGSVLSLLPREILVMGANTKYLTFEIGGGSWYDRPWSARAASLFRSNADDRDFSIGFRIVIVNKCDEHVAKNGGQIYA